MEGGRRGVGEAKALRAPRTPDLCVGLGGGIKGQCTATDAFECVPNEVDSGRCATPSRRYLVSFRSIASVAIVLYRYLEKKPEDAKRMSYPSQLSAGMPSRPGGLKPQKTGRMRREPSGVFSLFQAPQIQQFKEAFQLIDHDKDGWINESDLREIFASLGEVPWFPGLLLY